MSLGWERREKKNTKHERGKKRNKERTKNRGDKLSNINSKISCRTEVQTSPNGRAHWGANTMEKDPHQSWLLWIFKNKTNKNIVLKKF